MIIGMYFISIIIKIKFIYRFPPKLTPNIVLSTDAVAARRQVVKQECNFKVGRYY